MESGSKRRGYGWAVAAGSSAALAAVSAKFLSSQMQRSGFDTIVEVARKLEVDGT